MKEPEIQTVYIQFLSVTYGKQDGNSSFVYKINVKMKSYGVNNRETTLQP